MRVTRASTPDVTSGWRGGACTAVTDDDDDDAGSFDPSGSTCIIGLVIIWLFCDFVFPSFILLDVRCTRPAREAQI